MAIIGKEFIKCPACDGELRIKQVVEVTGTVWYDDLPEELCMDNKVSEKAMYGGHSVIWCLACKREWEGHYSAEELLMQIKVMMGDDEGHKRDIRLSYIDPEAYLKQCQEEADRDMEEFKKTGLGQ